MPEARVASIHDLADGEMMTVTVGDTEALLSRIDGTFHACGARCTHYGAPLADGTLAGTTVVCPWHHARFDVTDGSLADPPALDALARYSARVDGEDVYVRVPDGATETPEGADYQESGGHPPESTDRGSDDRTFVVIGGGAAGEMAVEELRAAGYAGRLILVTGDEHRPYDRTKLSKAYLAGGADDDALPLRTKDFYDRRDVGLLQATVTKLDAAAKEIHFDGADAETLAYDRVLVATGGTPRTLNVPGADLDGVYTLRGWDDARRIAERADGAERAVVIGSSFIGMEAAASLTGRGLHVEVVSTDEVPFEAVLGPDVGRVFQQLHEENGVTFHLGQGVRRIEKTDGGLAATMKNGTKVEGDFIVVGIGVEPATGFLDGVRVEQGAVVVDAHLSAGNDVFAAGDIARFPEPRTGQPVRIEHWRLAQQHGRVAARNMAGETVAYEGAPFFWSGQFGTNIRYLGHAEEWDEVYIDGSLDDRQFIAYYLNDGAVLAAAGVGRDREMTALHGLMLAGNTPSADEVKAGVDVLARLSS